MFKRYRIWMLAVGLYYCLGVNAKPLHLVTTEWETFTSDGSHSARLNDFVQQAFARAGYEVTITIERPAFAGSGLNTGKYHGRIDFIDLNPQQAGFSYSQRYFPINLHLISKTTDIESVRTFSQIRNARVAVENRYAASPSLRLVKEVKWSRNPTTFQSIANLAGERSDYLLSDSLIFNEFNRLLDAEDQELLHKSAEAMFVTGLHVSLNNSIQSNIAVLAAFDNATTAMLADGSVNRAFGLEWILADINDDGVAEWISSSNVNHPHLDATELPTDVRQSALQWDDSRVDSEAIIVIDGRHFSHWPEALDWLKSQVATNQQLDRSSFLDPSAYKKILSRW
jgi:ABC-type amino acid transport substrate-binding protein